MRRSGWVLSLVSAGCLLGAGASHVAHAQDEQPSPATDGVAMTACAETFADGLNRKDANAVRGVCTPELWARLAETFGTPQRSSRVGTYQFAYLTFSFDRPGFNRPGYMGAALVYRASDGVEDLVSVTLKLVGNQWKVAGGPSGQTPTRPLD